MKPHDPSRAFEIEAVLRRFLDDSRFADAGGIVTDLDGTAVHEFEGRIVIPQPVEFGLKRLWDIGRPIVLNSLRFPLSVIRTFGQAWYNIANAPIPTISLNGSLIGYITKSAKGELEYDEIDAFPLSPTEIAEIMDGIHGLIDGGVRDLVFFYYPRNWRAGEIIWTPVTEKIPHLIEKYSSAASVISTDLTELRARLLAEEICMIFLLIEIEEDKLMAYQHSKRSNFLTHKGVDKLHGTKRIAAALEFDLPHSVGAGDTQMDNFLQGVGLALHVGPMELEFKGRVQTLKIRDSLELGALLFRLAQLLDGTLP